MLQYPPLDRSNGFLLKHEWLTVYSENKPDFKKPPLQYWVTAFSLKNFSDTTFATRLPSFLFGIGLLVATGFLACLIEPDNPYAAPAAMIILSSSTFYWQMAISAFLDTGMVFFSVVAVVATFALRRPKFWYLAALAVGAGALQKAPVAALLVGGILLLVPLTKKYHEIKLAAVFANKHFRIALLLSVVLIAFWPALQAARFGYKAIEQQYVDEMLERFNPIKPVTQFHGWYDIFISAEAVVWIPAIIATLILPFVFKKFEAFVPVFIFLGFCLVVGKASGFVHHRYALLTLPFLAASLAALLARVLPGRITVLACAVGLSFLVGGPFKRAEALGLMFNGQEQYKPLLERLRAALLPQETLITCRWKEVPDPTIWILPGSLSYYGSNGHPIYLMRRPEDISRQEHIKNKIRPPYRGLCRSVEFEQLKEWLADYRVVEQSNGYVHWISNGSVQPPR